MAWLHLLMTSLALLGWPASCSAKDMAEDVVLGASRDEIEEIYWRGRAQADRALATLWKDQERLTALHNSSEYAYEVWDKFPPYYNCPSREKIGNQPEDGGKWMCGVNALLAGPSCIVYSFGSNGETSWEKALLERAPLCEVHVFDPTLSEAEQRRMGSLEGIHFHNLGLGAADGRKSLTRTDKLAKTVLSELRTLRSIMLSLGHNWIDVLKIDIEGSEWEVLQQILDEKEWGAGPLPFTQLQIELHYPWSLPLSGEIALTIMERLTKQGNLRAFNREYNPCCHWALVEYSFIQVSPHGHVVTSTSRSARRKQADMQHARHI